MEIKAADVMKLRQMTGAGMMDCKKALIEAEGDYDRAQEIIREKGKLVAAKRADRETTEGAVLARIDGQKAILVCLGCETDFVSKNAEFQALANSIADAAIAAYPADKDALMSVVLADGRTVEAAVTEQTGKTGEKHVVAYYSPISAAFAASYIHHNGKVAAVVGFSKEVSADVARGIAIQVATMNPVSVSDKDCPAEVVEKEIQIYKEQMKEDPKMAGKPEAMLEQIAKGKLGKFFKENTLLEQVYQMGDGKQLVKEVLAASDKDAQILGFRRFSLAD
ncbi:MAG: translation elongation factor Ts [Rikenellaceae bacterium]|nr:translation elongation factor Ts [Rikenellaceae bacterium]MDY4481730.1 translation elongation factor Ts [Candidatus Cryptobacteroides sp.]MDY4917152.1 translation elongation factor Ts [Candidatus Cryptobacteroides sp.]